MSAQCCEIGLGYSVGATELYHGYRAWGGGGDQRESQQSFGRELTARGFPSLVISNREPVRRAGVRLVASPDEFTSVASSRTSSTC